MSNMKRRLCCTLILVIAILAHASGNANGQTPDAKPRATGSISGHVTIGDKAAAAIAVAAFGSDTINRRVAAAQTVTDNEGNYRLSGLAPSQYQIATLTPNLTTAEGSGLSYGFVYFGSSKNIILAAGEEVGDIDIKLVRGGVITGRITDADNKPVIEERVALQLVDENGNPARTPASLPYGGQMYQTDDRGIYRIYGLPANHYKVSIGYESGGGHASNGRGYYPRTFYPDVTDPAKATIIELTEGSEATNIDIKVGSRSETHSAAGRVIDSETGLPVAGVRVTFLVASQNPERYSPILVGSPMDSRGEFRMDGLTPGHYGVYVSPEFDAGEFYSDPLYFDVVDTDITGLEVKAVRGLSISGVVVIEGDARKDALAQLAGIRISARLTQSSRPQMNLSSGSTSLIAADGTFQVNGLRPGRVSIGLATVGPGVKGYSIERIEHDGLGVTQGFEIQPGQSISGLRVVLNYGTGIIRGTVRFEGGSLPADARTFITCKREGARDGTGAQLDSRGHFVISNLAPGTYDLTLQLTYINSARPQRPRPPQKQIVNVTNDSESEVSFVVDLRPKEGGP